jgi:hypothetical protein
MSPMLCRLNAALPEGIGRNRITRKHFRSCLRCQALEARGRLLRRELANLGGEVTSAPPYLAAAVMAHLGEQEKGHARRRIVTRPAARYVAVAGVGAAAAAAVITGMVRRRSRIA